MSETQNLVQGFKRTPKGSGPDQHPASFDLERIKPRWELLEIQFVGSICIYHNMKAVTIVSKILQLLKNKSNFGLLELPKGDANIVT